ncbi:NfeD family protein [Draconibacterium orientale]|jgi:membrane-bound ClpP family serine protease|uniref:NfeD family protein n=1 Tax=Draconibacterium orientale TaxID=1168034 RepID=UPI002A0A8E11|nr:NfeD family protein [Draconibacterium orientale]
MSILAIILLILLGLVLLLIEFAVIPGVTIAGIGGFLLLGGAVYVAFAEYGTLAGFITLAAVLILAPTMIFYFFKSRTGKKMILQKNIDGKVDLINKEKIVVGDTGKSIGRLAPTGKVKINGETVEAQSTGSFIDHNTEIRVLKIEYNKIIVEPIKK